MKKLLICTMSLYMLCAFVPMISNAAQSGKVSVPRNTTSMAAEEKALTSRLEEIKNMDKSNMSRVEKKELRKEVRTIKSKVKKLSGGVYISASTLLVILILVIILL